MMARSYRRSAATLTALLCAVLGACTSGPGPLAQPDLGQAALVRAAAAWLADSDRLVDAPTYVLDRLDPTVMSRAIWPESFTGSVGDPDPASVLDDPSIRAIRDELAPRSVTTVSARTDVPAGETVTYGGVSCTEYLDGATYLALASVPGIAVHGDVYVVVVELGSGCGTQWLGLRLVWRPGAPIGGTWEVAEGIDGGEVAV